MSFRTYMVTNEKGEPIAQHLDVYEMLELVRLLTIHNDLVAWTIIPDYIEHDGERCNDDNTN